MEPAALGSGPSLWQVGAALVAVLGLLIVVLKFLQRWQRADNSAADAQILAVRRLGPKREVQTLRVGDEVHTLYRQESAMVLLKSESVADHRAAVPAATAARPLGDRLRALVAAAGGASRTADTP